MITCKELLMDLATLYNALDRFELLPASEYKTQIIERTSKEITSLREEIFRECK
jgi:hypothetical protein